MSAMIHDATVKHSSDRVLDMNYKTMKKTKTVAWRTYCSCGHVIETKSNNHKSHIAKVAKHNTAGENS